MVGRGGDFTFENGGNGEGWSYKKLDLLTFDGQNPDGRILVAERFFKFYRLTEEVEPDASVVASTEMLYFGSSGEIGDTLFGGGRS